MKNFYRIIIACLICSLFLGYACMPVKVEAAAATVAIGVAGASASVAPYVALGIVLLLACGYVIETLPKLIDDATSWINSIPGLVTYLKEQAAAGLTSMAVLQLPAKYLEPMKEKAEEYNKKQPEKPMIYIPPNFHQLDRLSQAQLLGEDVTAELVTGNWLAQGLNNIALNIHGAIYEFGYSIQSVLDHIPTSLTTLRTQLTSGIDGLSTTMQTFRQNFVNGLSEFQDVVSEFRAAVNNNFSKLMDSLGAKIGDVNIHLHAIRENLTSRLANLDDAFDVKMSDVKIALSGFRTQFVEKIGSLQNTLSTFRTQFVEKVGDIRDVVGDIRGNLAQSVTVGINNIASKTDTVISSIGEGINDMKVAIKELSATLTEALTVSFTIPAPPSFDSNNPDNEKINVTGGLGWFGNSRDILGVYGVGVLAAGVILKQFTDMKYFDSLITVALSIGLVAVFFGMFLNVAQADNAKSKQAQRASARAGKGG